MRYIAFLLGACGAALLCGSSGVAQSAQREPTDVYIRRLAGLPAASAIGQIEITDVGHGAMETMVSIVGNRTEAGWTASYACAASPRCAPSADHLSRSYTLSKAASDEVDMLLQTLGKGAEPDGQPLSPTIIGGWLTVSIDYHGFRRRYRRVLIWGDTLGRLERLLSPPVD